MTSYYTGNAAFAKRKSKQKEIAQKEAVKSFPLALNGVTEFNPSFAANNTVFPEQVALFIP